jgi:hypothetical protein
MILHDYDKSFQMKNLLCNSNCDVIINILIVFFFDHRKRTKKMNNLFNSQLERDDIIIMDTLKF